MRLAPSWGSVAMVVSPSVTWNRLCPCHLMRSMVSVVCWVFFCVVQGGRVGIPPLPPWFNVVSTSLD